MENQIDCLLIGHNEQKFKQKLLYSQIFSQDKVIQRDLNLHYLQYDNKVWKFSELLEKIANENNNPKVNELNIKIEEILYPSVVYLGSYLNNRGISFDYINSFQNHKDELKSKLENCNIVAITTTLYVTIFPIKEITDFIKSFNKNIKIVVGGPFMWQQFRTLKDEEIKTLLNSIGADFYINSSYGEEILVKIINANKTNYDFENINNIYYKNNNEYKKTKSLVDGNGSGNYTANWELFKENLNLHAWIRTSLSCPYSCYFCDFPPRMGKYIPFQTDDIQKELDSIFLTDKVKSVRFVDDTFNIPKKRFRSILKMMIDRDYSFKWTSFIRCDLLDEEIVDLMRESGCVAVHLGIESGSDRILNNMNKKTNIEHYANGISLLHKVEIITFASFIIGFPGETSETIQETINFIENVRPRFYFLHPWYCSPLTPIWEIRDKYNLEGWGYDWTHSTMKSEQVMDCIEEMFLAIYNSIHCSFHGDFTSFLLDFFSIKQLEDFSVAFNEGIRMKLKDPEIKNISSNVVYKLKQSISGN